MKPAVACAVGLVALAVLIGNAFYIKGQFYPAMVYLSKSKVSLYLLYGELISLMIMVATGLKYVFFNELTQEEIDALVRTSWVVCTETLVGFATFRGDVNLSFSLLILFLLFIKSFHYLAAVRLDQFERTAVIPRTRHFQMSGVLAFMFLVDVAGMILSSNSIITDGVTVKTVFGFEYATLSITALSLIIRYALNSAEALTMISSDKKSVILLVFDVINGQLKVLLFTALFVAMLSAGTLPIHICRRLFFTLREFVASMKNLFGWRRAVERLERVFVDATEEEIREAELCVVCRETLEQGAKKLPCNHVFHVQCLRSWFQRQQTCPTCRLHLLRTQPSPVRTQPQPEPRTEPLSPSDLAQMERSGQEAVMARLRCLQRVQEHLDESLRLIQSYQATLQAPSTSRARTTQDPSQAPNQH